MGRKLFTISPAILAAAQEYLTLSSRGELRGVHVADCFPVEPEEIVRIWEDALFDLRRRNERHDFGVASVTVFKDGFIAAEFYNLRDPHPQHSLFASLD